jgi:hypothetical protein
MARPLGWNSPTFGGGIVVRRVIHSYAACHHAFTSGRYAAVVLGTLRVRPVEGNEPLYQVVIPLAALCDAEPAVRELIERHRGELKQLRHETQGRRARLHLYLGRRRIDDIVSALESAGFEVGCLIATLQGR